jgi:AcrR family transcriptional regulator
VGFEALKGAQPKQLRHSSPLPSPEDGEKILAISKTAVLNYCFMTGQALRRKPPPQENDETRERLLEAAGAVFAEKGFHDATIREISAKSGANVAAINYHFRDKLGLYSEVLERSIKEVPGEVLRDVSAGSQNPEETLRQSIHRMLERMLSSERGAWYARLMAHEMAQPTPALAQVIERALRPKYDSLRQLIGSILQLPANHDVTRLSAHSVIGQVVHYAQARPAIGILWPELKMTPQRLRQIADHIADFTLCHLHAAAKKSKHRN